MADLGPVPVGEPLAVDAEADVVIVGAGYTGLWTAYYLAERDPSLSIVVLEQHRVGYGASGRNGGWLTPSRVDTTAMRRSTALRRCARSRPG